MSSNAVEVLERLAKLKDSGAISGDEYDAEKRKILG
nr:SHOCT domain-containing protein [Rhizobium sp. BG4]